MKAKDVIRIGRTVEEIFFASIRSTLSGMENLEWAIESHRNVIAKMKAGDGDQIYRAVVASLAAWGSEVEKRTQPSEAVSA
jgi:DNA-binding GntR family transcriptional regulator